MLYDTFKIERGERKIEKKMILSIKRQLVLLLAEMVKQWENQQLILNSRSGIYPDEKRKNKTNIHIHAHVSFCASQHTIYTIRVQKREKENRN